MVLMLFAACAKVEDDFNISSQVSLKASIGPVLSATYTKVSGEIKSNYADTLHIGLARVHGSEANFEDAGNERLKAVMHAPTAQSLGLRDIAFEQYQGFPDAITEVNYVGWYPYGESVYANPASGETTVTINVPADGSKDILYSDIATGTRSKGFNNMTFSHALVKYSINAYAMETTNGESVESVWGAPKTIELLEMPTTCVLALPSSADDAVEVRSSGTQTLASQSKYNSFKEGFDNALELATFLAPAPAENILRIKVTTQKGDSQIVESQTLSIAKNFQSGKHYQIYLRFTTHGTINADVSVEDWTHGGYIGVESNVGVYYDLSETHTANSYMVSSANNYCFNATVRGNGYTGAVGIPGAPVDIYKLDEPVSAEIIWTDLVSSATDNMDAYFHLDSKIEEGRVFFTVVPYNGSMKEGNVVVGVRDKDKNLLWTWHLWLTDRPAEQGYKNGFAVQDRDLGATAYDAKSEPAGINGLYYQWGRPTPLPLGSQAYVPEYNEDGTWRANRVFQLTESADEAKITTRVANPDVYYNAKATAAEGKLTKSLWGWRKDTDEYAKTIYDPCPPGYRVPSVKLWRDLVMAGDVEIVSEKANGNGDGIGNQRVLAASFNIDVNLQKVYYPVTGYFTDKDTHVDENVGAYVWAATFYLGELDNLADDQPYALDFALENNGHSFKDMELRQEYSHYALPVRCISRMSKAHVTNLSDFQTANSYMVHKDGYYKFKATVRGNGVGQLVSPGSTAAIVLTEQLQTVDISSQLVKVEPLWWHSYASPAPASDEFNQGKHFIMLNEGKPDADGYVSFQVQNWYKGNLILVGRNAKDEIIWSWHIWFTDEPDMMKSNSFVVMDRNLGATYAPVSPTPPTTAQLSETYGFYYQWGRKDPFLQKDAAVYMYNPIDGTYTASKSAFSTESVVANKTVANSVQNPMTYHLASQSSSLNGVLASTYMSVDFNVTSDNNDSQNQCYSNMVHPESRQSLWGYSAATGYGVTTTKTMYDPCPPGYIVAHYLVWTNTERNLYENLYYTNLDGGISSRGLSTQQEDGIFLNYGLAKNDDRNRKFDSAWFPFSGYLRGIYSGYELKEDSYNNYKSVSAGLFHTSTPAGNGSRGIYYDAYSSGQAINTSGELYGLPSTFAYPVRCQKE